MKNIQGVEDVKDIDKNSGRIDTSKSAV